MPILKFKGHELRGPVISIFQKKKGNLMALLKNSRRQDILEEKDHLTRDVSVIL